MSSYKDRTNLQDETTANAISLLIDDQLEAAALDKLLEANPEAVDTTLKYYVALQQVMQRHASSIDVTQLDIRDRIKAQIQNEPLSGSARSTVVTIANSASDNKPDNSIGLITRSYSATRLFAIAASVAFVMVLGTQLFWDGQEEIQTNFQTSTEMGASDVLANPQDIQSLPLNVQNERLKSYLRQHAEQATMASGQGMMPMARLVSYPIEEQSVSK
jgi:sigma-E factor negative regulatory protein RseA